jgi:D-3-phosphoglycerate dehydrogenase / 2-oxoglutarate reductase
MVDIFLTHNPEDLDIYFGPALEAIQAYGTVRANPGPGDLTTEELIEAARGCEIIVCHRATAGEAAVFEQLPDLVAFLRPQLDIRNIDIEAASAAGVVVANAEPAFIPATAEMAIALMLDVSRDVTESTVAFRRGETPPSNMGRQLATSTAGVIGYGAVGRYLCDILLAMGMRVLVNDPYVTVDKPGLEQVDFETVLRQSDYVLPLAVATGETENLMDAAAFALMKPSAVFVNVSRGNLVDEDALEAAYTEGRIAKLAMDVGRAADQRPSPRLAALPGVVATPHLGGLTPQNAHAQSLCSVEQTAAIVEGRVPPRAVNAEHATRLARLMET